MIASDFITLAIPIARGKIASFFVLIISQRATCDFINKSIIVKIARFDKDCSGK